MYCFSNSVNVAMAMPSDTVVLLAQETLHTQNLCFEDSLCVKNYFRATWPVSLWQVWCDNECQKNLNMIYAITFVNQSINMSANVYYFGT